MRRAARTDRNHSEIAGAFVALGCSVRSLAAVGGGMPDLLVALRQVNLLIEIKDGDKPKSATKLTPAQEHFRATWQGPVHIVRCLEDVKRVVESIA